MSSGWWTWSGLGCAQGYRFLERMSLSSGEGGMRSGRGEKGECMANMASSLPHKANIGRGPMTAQGGRDGAERVGNGALFQSPSSHPSKYTFQVKNGVFAM